ncbi:MAG TPA: hypothetical protein VLM79_06545 [Kofleriaceae bacterium]|nr:hypothetical protein [Kofleriaceae bacterium]
MRLCPLTIAALAAAVSTRATAAPLVVVVREGSDDALAVARLRGQLADLDVTLTVARGAVEPALDNQLASAARLADDGGARAVVWFIARGGGLSVAVATPGDHRLFVREIPAADPSAVAEAAAVAARGAIRALGEGGTIGVEVAPLGARRGFGLELAIGWQVALDAGADVGAQAIAQRTTVARGPWAGALALTLGPALRHDAGAAAVELSRSSAALALERRMASFALAVSAGAALYHRATVATSGDLAPTPAAVTVAAIAGAELRWRWRPRGGSFGVDAMVGVDVVPGAPELAVARGAEVDSLGRVRMVQPRFSLSFVAGLP